MISIIIKAVFMETGPLHRDWLRFSFIKLSKRADAPFAQGASVDLEHPVRCNDDRQSTWLHHYISTRV